MCGIVGYLGGSGRHGSEADEILLKRMADTIRSRGPDDCGVWFDASDGVGLAHRRLSILDLSPAGHQPMHSASGRYVIIFNGEIYNHLELREDLKQLGTALQWRGHSDTETLLAGFETWGIKGTIRRCAGMFAIAVVDRKARTLTLVRDRIGEKPLYYGWQQRDGTACFLFGSELKALKLHPSFNADIDRDALCLMMRHNYIPAPYSIYQGIRKLIPGSLLTIPLSAAEGSRGAQAQSEPEPYWSLAQVAEAGCRERCEGGDKELVGELESLLKTVIGQQMISDVPLGAFLSGGVDSSAVVALMQSQSLRPVKTFTIGFDESDYNEAIHAKKVAEHLGTEHTELYVTPKQALDVVPRLPVLYDEPFADSSQIPTFLVSHLARRNVTVSLSGDGGDELFGGYTRYLVAAGVWQRLSKVPVPLRVLAAKSLTSLSPQTWDGLACVVPGLKKRLGGRFGDKVHKAAGVFGSDSIESLYKGLVSHWDDPESLVLGSREPPTFLTARAPKLAGLSEVERMMALDMLSYLPDDILAKVDRAAMGISLETRVPFLDHRVIEYAWQLPQTMKFRNGQGKWALRQVLYKYVPKELIERPKMGFGIPLDAWLSGPLRDWAEDLLDEKRLQQEGFFHPLSVRKKWEEHLAGRRNWSYHLWGVLMFQAWLAGQRD